ncbi:hypothetical protein GA0111570_106217 [Raineyella antarctica]|uniref:Uncharacterized protein n=1 Tax=Raineyella antarctica TaxID=1577474 RepID=A0A1G6H4T3_9ACTN|nr:DUF6350 family protein [Raineyella antarctica]SDB89300.1 hypothetical protein GA0111570_106217 [Raineyella antarctica]
MSQNRNSPPRTRPDLGGPTGHHRSRRDARARSTEGEQEAVVEGVTGLRPPIPSAEDPYVPPEGPRWGAAVVAGGAAAIVGWVLLAALSTLAWLTAPVGSYGGVLKVSTQLWLAGHGGGLVVGATRWTLVPFGLSVVLGLLLAQVGIAVLRRLGEPEDSPQGTRLLRGALMGLTYAVVVAVTGLLAGGPAQAGKALGGAVVLTVLASWWSRSRVRLRNRLWWPAPVVEAARALAVGLLALLVVGAAALVTGLVVHRGELVLLTQGIGGGALGGLGVVLAQAAYVPTFVLWAMSYTLGAGFGLGDGSLVSPSDTHLGLLPGWPISAALPAPGPGTTLDLAWLAGGVLAGGLAAWVYLRRSRWTRPDTGMLFGGLVGVGLGLLATLVGLLSRGDLGVARLAGLGPRPLELLVLGTVLTTGGGLATGLAYGIVRSVTALRRRRAAAAAASADSAATLGDPPSSGISESPAVQASAAPHAGEGPRPATVTEDAPEVSGPVLANDDPNPVDDLNPVDEPAGPDDTSTGR